MKTHQILLIIGIVTGIISAVLFGFGIFTTSPLSHIIEDQAWPKAVMKSSTYSQWGQIPGDYNVNVTRKYTFFNFTNPFDVFWFNSTPVFNEVPAQLYQEFQNFTNPVYHPDTPDQGTTVDFGFQLGISPLNTPEVDPITTPNLGPLGFWYSSTHLPAHQMTFYGLITLILGMQQTVITGVQSAGLLNQCLVSQGNAATAILTPAGITDPTQQNFLWSDPVYGLGNTDTLTQWVLALTQGALSDSAYILQDYFFLTPAQIATLFDATSPLSTCFGTLNQAMQTQYSCAANPCDPKELATAQWASQAITTNPPANFFTASPSAGIFNTSIQGYAEISYFLSAYFLENEPVDPSRYTSLTFTNEAPRLIEFAPTAGNLYSVCTNPDTLLNMGNLAFLLEVGAAFDAANNINDLSPLQPIVDRFGLSSQEQAHVIYKYVEYFRTEFILQTARGGTAADTVVGQLSTGVISMMFGGAQQAVPQDLTVKVMVAQIAANASTCNTVFTASSPTLTADQITTMCQTNILKRFDYNSIAALYGSCLRPNGAAFNSTLHSIGTLTAAQFNDFCTTVADGSFMAFVASAGGYLKEFYNCSTTAYPAAPRCSERQFMVMQWASSAITSNVPPLLEGQFTPSLTIMDWYPENLYTVYAIEYLVAVNPLAQNFASDPTSMNPMSYDIANAIFTYNGLVNQVTVQNAFISFNKQDWNWFSDNLPGAIPYSLITYYRALVLEFFGGFGLANPADGLLWGYTDLFLFIMSQQAVYASGDPSLSSTIALAGSQNATLFNATMHTGIDDHSLTRQFASINELNTISFNLAYFDGNETASALTSPWAQQINISGTDGSQDAPGLDSSDDVSVYLSDIYFNAPLAYNTTQDYSGLNAYRYKLTSEALLSKAKNSDNAKWFSDQWDGLLNISMIQKAPLFISKGHLLDAESDLQNAIKIYKDNSLTELVTPNSADDTFLDIEPYSGVTVGTMVRLQINLEFKSDSLIPNPNYAMLPILLTERGMNFTSDQVQQVFSQLVSAEKFKSVGTPVFFSLGAVFLVATIVLFIKRRSLVKKTAVKDESSYNKMVEENSRA